MSTRLPSAIPATAIPAPAWSAPGRRDIPRRRTPWLWWHLLSLDAPTVAILWCWFFGAVFGLHFCRAALPTLGLGTWCVYVLDRLLDGWGSAEPAALRDRHWFYLLHRRMFLAAWIVAAIPLAALILFSVDARVRVEDIALCLIGIAYFLLVHGRLRTARNAARWLPKELAVGFLFAIATAAPAWARIGAAERGPLLATVLSFGTLCWLNCVAIQTWEDAEAADEAVHAILSPACPNPGGATEFLGHHLSRFAAAAGLLSLLLAALMPTGAPLFAAAAISAAIILALNLGRGRARSVSLRIAADLALLTPLLFLLRY